MKNYLSLLIVLCLVINFPPAFGQINWQHLEGPYGGSVNDMLLTPANDIIAITSENVYKSTNQGLQWNRIDFNQFIPLHLHYFDNMVFGLSHSDDLGDNFVYRSSDNMETWVNKSTGLENRFIHSLQKFGADLYACSDSGIYKSTNNGDSWSYTYPVPKFKYNRCYNININSKGMIFIGTIESLYRSTDNGASWEVMNPSNPGMKSNINSVTINSEDRIIVVSPSGMFRSNNDGKTWVQIGEGIINSNISSLLNPSGKNLIAGLIGGGIFVSSDDGDTWKKANSIRVTKLIITQDNKYLTGNSNGVFFADSLKGEWSMRVNGINETQLSCVFINKSNNSHNGEIIIGAVDGTIYKSTNGAVWEKKYKMTGSTITSIVAGKDGWMFAASVWGGVARSSDYGDNWESTGDGLDDPDVRTLAIDKNGNLYAGTFSAIYKSTNNGANWTVSLSQQQSVQCSTIVVSSKNEIYAGTMTFGLLKSTNNGTTWLQKDSGIELPISYVAINSKDELFAVAAGGPLFTSTNGGTNWTKICINTGIVSMVFLGDDDILAGVDQNHEVVGVLRSTNKGVNWTPVQNGMGNLYVFGFDVNSSGVVYAATMEGVFCSSQALVSVEESINFDNIKIYPNPVKSDGLITLSLNHSGVVRLELFDMMGKRIIALGNEFRETGDYSINLSPYGLAPGSYYLKCVIDGKSFTSPVVIY